MIHLVHYKGEIGVVSSDDNENLRFVDRHGIPYSIRKTEVFPMLGGSSYYYLIRGTPYRESHVLPGDKVAYATLQKLPVHM